MEEARLSAKRRFVKSAATKPTAANEEPATPQSPVRPPATRERLERTSPIEDRAPEIIRRLTKAYLKATVALRATNPLEMLVATILSAQCTDERVNAVTETLFVKYRTPQDYLAVPASELASDIRSTGFFNQKTKSIRGACERIVEVYDGKVPGTMEDLLTLPGVARKTANVVLGNSFGRVEGIAVDTHVGRVSRRLGFTDQRDPVKVEQDLMRILPKSRWLPFTYKLIDHGRAVCVARSPKCTVCPVEDLCPSSEA
ncbi:MAG: endonuclease III [Actinomycetota bacterium]